MTIEYAYVMGMSANVQSISKSAFEAASNNNLDNFSTDNEHVNLDKCWHAISYLLTGKSDLGFLEHGIQLVDVAEHAEVHSPQAVRDLGSKFELKDAASFLEDYDPIKFQTWDIYPGGWDGSELSVLYIKENLENFMNFVRLIANEDKGFFVLIC